MSVRSKRFITIALVYAGILLAFASYEYFNKITPNHPPLVMRSWVDAQLPLVPVLVIPYLSFHLLAAIAVPWLSLKGLGLKAFLSNGVALIVSQLALDIAYYLFQTEVPRPRISDTPLFNWILVHVVWGNDRPLNGFPSNHVTWSVISIIALWRLRHRYPKIAGTLIAWFLMIIPATVLLAQHFIIDIYGGVFVAFTSFWAVVFILEKPNLAPITDGNPHESR
jgi:membrane-associated phospholipid phosphatase